MTPRTAGIFAGVGGLELGFERAGFETTFLCESMPEAHTVLGQRFPEATRRHDIRSIVARQDALIPCVEVVLAGFPCQDLSQAGGTRGIRGMRSGIVESLFQLLERRRRNRPDWLVLENVPFMLSLDRGRAMNYLTRRLEGLGCRWAYRVVDTRAFGLPQRRRRVILVASRSHDPREVLFSDEADELGRTRGPSTWCGFYWTEGNRGLGWTIDGIPPLKAGSTIGIPSPPAVYRPGDGSFWMPAIEHAEELQGFPQGWTEGVAAENGFRTSARWRLVGNAVSVPVSRWVGSRILEPGKPRVDSDGPMQRATRWPNAAWGERGIRRAVGCSAWPLQEPYESLSRLVRRSRTSMRPLSLAASSGFLSRIEASSLRTDARFIPSLRNWVSELQRSEASTADLAVRSA